MKKSNISVWVIFALATVFFGGRWVIAQTANTTATINKGEVIRVECADCDSVAWVQFGTAATITPTATAEPTATLVPPPPPEDTLTPTLTNTPTVEPTNTPEATPTEVQSGAALFTDGDKVMTMIDSITKGKFRSSPSYQEYLAAMLDGGGYAYDFVGPYNRPDSTWDSDTAASVGWQIDWWLQMAQSGNWFGTYAPDIVLIHAGTNGDAGSHANDLRDPDGNFKTVVDSFRAANPDVVIVVSTILGKPPLENQDPELIQDRLEDYNNELVTFATNHTTEQSPIVIVDGITGFDRSEHTDDNVHLNETGAEMLAQRWYQALVYGE